MQSEMNDVLTFDDHGMVGGDTPVYCNKLRAVSALPKMSSTLLCNKEYLLIF